MFLKRKKKGTESPAKYKAKKVVIDGITFASTLEGNCYKEIKKFGVTCVLQPKFLLQEGFRSSDSVWHRPIHYIGDFILPTKLIIDSKGILTPEYKLKKKLFLKRYPEYRLVEIKSAKAMREFLEKEYGEGLERK